MYTAVVREACEDMVVKQWYSSAAQNPIAFLRMLDVELCTDVCLTALRAIITKGMYIGAK